MMEAACLVGRSIRTIRAFDVPVIIIKLDDGAKYVLWAVGGATWPNSGGVCTDILWESASQHFGKAILEAKIRKVVYKEKCVRVLSLRFADVEAISALRPLLRDSKLAKEVIAIIAGMVATDFVDIMAEDVVRLNPDENCVEDMVPDGFWPKSIEGLAPFADFHRACEDNRRLLYGSDYVPSDTGSYDSDDFGSWLYESDYGLPSMLRWKSSDGKDDESKASEPDLNAFDAFVQDVPHTEPAAARDEELAAQQADEDWAAHVEGRLHGPMSGASTSLGHEPLSPEPIYLLRFGTPRNIASQSGEPFRDALLNSSHLRSVCEALGASCVHPSGALLFLRPEQVEDVLRKLEELELHPFHVVVASSLEAALQDALVEIPSRKRPREKKGTRIEIMSPPNRAQSASGSHETSYAGAGAVLQHQVAQSSPAFEMEHVEVFVVEKRTFLCMAPQMRAATSVVQSTTEAVTDGPSQGHYGYHRGLNPRRPVLHSF